MSLVVGFFFLTHALLLWRAHTIAMELILVHSSHTTVHLWLEALFKSRCLRASTILRKEESRVELLGLEEIHLMHVHQVSIILESIRLLNLWAHRQRSSYHWVVDVVLICEVDWVTWIEQLCWDHSERLALDRAMTLSLGVAKSLFVASLT